ncbi:MAG TPA: 16S rRNA (guanine(527)-N(7))-methyltransferase RsmG [Cyclobacteriaceae bacterium]|nr:16S rRNA (guanine(527)-N(7))-methyltransferase RsmG [Cyclobacteriaceae bacterium]HMV09746.1 16S rRNA (guanine(527)-N(7))-methyltransferase RsmG [Cyclobacteriaceae bacterium]HMX02299.1 16S rRNA (guanine(527)-N(7))-methyltransferase RsmG [Cyclobacteriaceae bacterium]HMX51160.1 16S rRNA (guanine(527)-N(7))-methyltransferase RsmG [Cyclobacteriaceae bacterium]HMY94036.1 16S rRNA (guanine(527)-N(7))-methyltransferase RsmG [Cyclobacteriaceae bacterium]
MRTEIILKYFPELTSHQKQQFDALFDLYKDWNEKINVISRKDIDNLYVNHILHSLGIAKVMAFKPGASVLDVGTGGGFPGIPLAILFPETNFHLVDSINKKITVVNEVAKGAGIKNVRGEWTRAELTKGKYDFIVSRAVTRIKEFYGWVHQKVKEESIHDLDNGILYLKGGDLDQELGELKRPYSLYELSNYFAEEFFETKKVVYVPI